MLFGTVSHVASATSCRGSLLTATSSLSLSSHTSPMANHIRIAVVGDIHNDWHLQEDSKALQLLRPDLVLFTGDFGNEDVELVRSIANLEFTKAAILGNHDAWTTQQFSKRKKDGVQLQLECLGREHVGYQRFDYPASKVSIVGGRPFSRGGERLFRQRLLDSRYGIDDMDGSAEKIYQAAIGAPEDHFVIILAHNGPKGLGTNINDICGRDWLLEGGDHGDPDLEKAIFKLKQTSKFSVPLVVFGHMHKELAYEKGLRKMIVVGADNTTYLNGAIVPRVRTSRKTQGTIRAFTLVEISHGKLERIAETWVSVFGEDTKLEEEQILYHRGAEINEVPL